MKLPLTIVVGIDIAYIGLAQADIIPADLIGIFIQLPLVGLFAWFVLRVLDSKDKQYVREIELLEKIIDRQDSRQADLIAALSALEKTLVLNTATVSESIRLSDLTDELKKTLTEERRHE